MSTRTSSATRGTASRDQVPATLAGVEREAAHAAAQEPSLTNPRAVWHDQCVYRSTSRDAGRDPWSTGGLTPPGGPSPGPAATGRASTGLGGRAEGGYPRSEPDDEADAKATGAAGQGEVPVRGLLSAAIAGFAALLGVGLVLAAQSAGPDHRLPFTVVVFGVQVLFVLAWTMALRPPVMWVTAGIGIGVAVAADLAAVLPAIAGIAPVSLVAAGGFLASVLGQLALRTERARVVESLGATMLIVVGVVAFATLIVLGRLPTGGAQASFITLTAAAVALTVAHLVDAVLPRPRMAPQVPRGATGVIVGAILGALAGAALGALLVGFTPTTGAVVGVAAAGTAVLADLAADYAEAGRQMAGDPPTMWLARHMQGPLGGFALAAPLAYAMTVLLL